MQQLSKSLRLSPFRLLARFAWRRPASIPLARDRVSAGFPSPADDYIEKRLDFNDLIVEEAAATFVAKVTGDSMKDAGIVHGDLVVINRARKPVSGDIVLALLDGEFTIKRYFDRGHYRVLRPENPAYKEIIVTQDRQFEVWGVVRRVIRVF